MRAVAWLGLIVAPLWDYGVTAMVMPARRKGIVPKVANRDEHV
jgi:hypothetical protein